MQIRGGFELSEVLPVLGPWLEPLADQNPPPIKLLSLDAPQFGSAHSLVVLGPKSKARELRNLQAGLLLVQQATFENSTSIPWLKISDARQALAALIRFFSERIERLLPPAGPNNQVAAGAIVEGILGGNVTVGAGAFVAQGAWIGPGTQIEPRAVVQAHVSIGSNCVVQSGAVIGCSGFGFFEANSTLAPMPHLSGVNIGNDCFIGANTVIAAGVLHPTEIGDHCKLDSHVQIAHNVILGKRCLLASQSGVAGSTRIGDDFKMGGAASVAGHLRLGNSVSVAAKSGVTKDIPDGQTVAGFPARPIQQWRRREAALRRFESKTVLPLQGLALHSGNPSQVRIERREEDSQGIHFSFGGKIVLASELKEWKRHAKRCTHLLLGEDEIRTPEHLLAACLFFYKQPIDIICYGFEPPGLDGSALPFYLCLKKAAPEIEPCWNTYSSNLIWSYSGPEGEIEAKSAENFSVQYILESHSLNQRFDLNQPEIAIREILPARTFIFLNEWKALVSDSSVLQGITLDSGLLLAENTPIFEKAKESNPEWLGKTFPLLHPENFRMPDEPVKHKILDLLGDLALLGLALPRLHIRIRNGGHALNHLLLEQLLYERNTKP